MLLDIGNVHFSLKVSYIKKRHLGRVGTVYHVIVINFYLVPIQHSARGRNVKTGIIESQRKKPSKNLILTTNETIQLEHKDIQIETKESDMSET